MPGKRVCAECGGTPFHATTCKFHVHGEYHGTVVTVGQAKPVESLVPDASTIASAIEDWFDVNKGPELYIGNAGGDFDLITIDGLFRISELAAAVYERLVGEGVRFGEDR